MKEGTAHIIYAASDPFAEMLGVSLVSLLYNSRDMDKIYIYVLDCGISDQNRSRLNRICARFKHRLITFIPASNINRELNFNVHADRGSISQYARLFLARHLPADLDRVLYLDSDTLIRHSVSTLWNLDMHGKTIAALMDAFSAQYRRNIDLDRQDIMFNSGVMLIDLNRWRDRHVETRLMQFISDKGGFVQQGDQGALNAVLSKDVCCFHPKFNAVTIFFDFSYKEMQIYRKSSLYYSEEKIREAVQDPYIIHFTTSFLSLRPWMRGCHHRYVHLWRRYREMTPWKDAPLRKPARRKGMEGANILFHLLPRPVAIHVAGIAQAYGRPFLIRHTLIKKFIRIHREYLNVSGKQEK